MTMRLRLWFSHFIRNDLWLGYASFNHIGSWSRPPPTSRVSLPCGRYRRFQPIAKVLPSGPSAEGFLSALVVNGAVDIRWSTVMFDLELRGRFVLSEVLSCSLMLSIYRTDQIDILSIVDYGGRPHFCQLRTIEYARNQFRLSPTTTPSWQTGLSLVMPISRLSLIDVTNMMAQSRCTYQLPRLLSFGDVSSRFIHYARVIVRSGWR